VDESDFNHLLVTGIAAFFGDFAYPKVGLASPASGVKMVALCEVALFVGDGGNRTQVVFDPVAGAAACAHTLGLLPVGSGMNAYRAFATRKVMPFFDKQRIISCYKSSPKSLFHSPFEEAIGIICS
jgi:hypothetical protein